MGRAMEREWGRDGSRRTASYVFTYIQRLLTTSVRRERRIIAIVCINIQSSNTHLSYRQIPELHAVRPWIRSLDTDLSYRP